MRHADFDGEHPHLAEELFKRYSKGTSSVWRRAHVLRKRWTWNAVVGGAVALKRGVDVAASIVLLIGLAPILLVVAAAIKLTDCGPVFYRQQRVGRWGREFVFPKFRSMVVDAESRKKALLTQNSHGDSVTFKMKGDPRVTWIGRIIRRLSIDELPQLVCVLSGKMTLVGPRPALPREVARYTLSDRRRLDATPGLTCIWQVSGRGDIPFSEQAELDRHYIESQSPWLDFKILLKTVPAVLTGRGAY